MNRILKCSAHATKEQPFTLVSGSYDLVCFQWIIFYQLIYIKKNTLYILRHISFVALYNYGDMALYLEKVWIWWSYQKDSKQRCNIPQWSSVELMISWFCLVTVVMIQAPTQECVQNVVVFQDDSKLKIYEQKKVIKHFALFKKEDV